MRHKVNIVETEAQMGFLGGHPAKYWPPTIVCSSVCVMAVIAVVLSCHDIADLLATISRYRCNNLKTNKS